jgi:hypothetical protein
MEGYLAWKWGLSSNLPVNHPYSATGPFVTGQSLTTFGNITTDINSNLQLSSSSNIVLASSGAQRMVIGTTSTTISNPLYARIPVIETSGTSITLASSNYGSYIYLTNSGFNAATLPAATPITDGGAFWTLRNATSSSLSITLTNTLNLVSPLVIPPSNTQTLVVSGNTSNTILLL